MIAAAGLALCSAIDALSRASLAPSIWFFWIGVAMIVAPIVYRLCSAEASLGERLALVCLLGLGLYAIKVMRDPFGYTLPDEFFHAHNAQQILSRHRLFGSNSMLPITPKYPGLEGATSALMSLTGMSSFGSGLIIVGAARLTMMVALFVLFNAISGSARIAGIGAATYAGNSNFLFFGAMFSYESLALPLFVVVLAIIATRAAQGRSRWPMWTLPLVLLIGAITVTHHLTSYLLDLVLVSLAGVGWLSRGRVLRLKLGPFAVLSLILTIAWLAVVASETVGYISPVVTQAFNQTMHTILGESAPRAPFQASPGGISTPIPDRVMAYAALLILAGAMPFGLIVAWRRHWRNPPGAALCVAGLGFFGVLALRVAPSAWEIANRTDEFLFIGLALLVGYAVVVRVLSGRLARFTRLTPALVALAAAVVVIGGALTGSPAATILAAPIRIRADGHAIQSETLALGEWTRSHLRGGGVAALEADARPILLYGNRRVLSAGGYPPIDAALTGLAVNSAELGFLRAHHVPYVVVDRRVRAGDNARGYAFSVHPPGGAPDDLVSATVAFKFDDLPVPRVYDSGNVFIYDLASGP